MRCSSWSGVASGPRSTYPITSPATGTFWLEALGCRAFHLSTAMGKRKKTSSRLLMTVTLTGPEVITGADVTTLPLAPKNPLPYWRRLVAIRQFDTGPELLRESGGPVTRIVLGPKWMMPPLAFVSSPQGAHDVLARTDAFAERAATSVALELRRLVGDNLLVMPHREWLPRRRALQPIFTKHHVPRFSGHMAEVAEQLADRWAAGATVDLDAECHAMTLRALGHSILGIDLTDRTQMVGAALRLGGKWAVDRALRPVN